MTTKENILDYVAARINQYNVAPIYEILLFVNPNTELYSKTGKPLGFPDLGGSDMPGFYYNIQDAIDAMHENACDIRECTYSAGFVLCRFPGLYESAGTKERMYFVWDDEKGGFYEQEEPEIFQHIAY